MDFISLILGALMIFVGALGLMSPNTLWDLDQIFYRIGGIETNRSERWWAVNRAISIISIMLGLLVIFSGFNEVETDSISNFIDSMQTPQATINPLDELR